MNHVHCFEAPKTAMPVVSGQFYLPSTLDMSLHALFSFKPPPKLMWTSPVSMPLGTYDQVQHAHGSKKIN
jgi:hypothetical protein